MKGHLSHDYLIEVPAPKTLRSTCSRCSRLGDGGVGTIVKLTYPPGGPSPGYMKEMYTKIEEEQRLKEAEIIEGGFRDLGFDLYRHRLQIIEKDARSSIIRSSIDYEIDDKLQELASQATMKPFEVMNEGVGKYLKQKWDSSNK